MIYVIITVFVVLADQFFKQWIVSNIELGGEIQLIPGIIHLTYIRNTGAAFSILENMRWVLLAVTAVCIVAIIIFLVKSRMNKIGKICISLVLGGAIGNAIDRVLYGYVVDMFCTDFITFPVFNIADCFIVAGGIAFCLIYIFSSAGKNKACSADNGESEQKADCERITNPEQREQEQDNGQDNS